MKKLVLIIPFVTACAHIAANDPHALMHANMTKGTAVKPIPDRDDDIVNWCSHDGSAAIPLKGIRIALDPGHIGTSPWDERNGKYVTDSNAKLSEGVMALQLSLLLRDQLTKMGANVFIDRENFTPVTARDFADLADSSEVFFQRLDLDARAEKIWKFHPDITLILHFDARLDKDMNLEHSHDLCNDTKTYVPGAFDADDLADRSERPFFNIIWRNPGVWQDDLDLSKYIVESIHGEMRIPLADKGVGAWNEIEPGVFARNLRLQRRLAGFVTSYVETLCYEDPGEFKALSQPDFKMKIGDQPLTYSRRLQQLATALRDAVLAFTRSRVETCRKTAVSLPQSGA